MTALTLFAPSKPVLPLVKRVLSTVTWVFLTLLIVATAALGVYIHTGHGSLSPVLTGSMRPGIQPGDVVVTKQVPVSSLHVGDIIVFHPPGQTLARVHRIASLQKAAHGAIAVTTKGDANNTIDPWGKILMKGNTYKASFVIPQVGWLLNDGARWLILGFVFIGAAAIGGWTWKYVRS